MLEMLGVAKVTAIAGQLALDLDAAMSSREDIEARIRATVAEDGMAPDEIDAAVNDALARMGRTAEGTGAARAR
ncbi:MAG: hypothetical protein H0T69_07760, partial [Thermoleophilaceae bacterium]|nr:hypothetical protein [Thermoleophilaceae bacterium]